MSRWISNSKRRIQKATERKNLIKHQSSMMMMDDQQHHHHHQQQLTYSNHNHHRKIVEVTIPSVNVPPPPPDTGSGPMKTRHSNSTKNHSCPASNYVLKDDNVQEMKRNETCWFAEREYTDVSSSWSSRRNPSKVEWANPNHQNHDRMRAYRPPFSKLSSSSNNRNEKDSNVSSAKKRSSFDTMDSDGGVQPFYKRLKYGQSVSK